MYSVTDKCSFDECYRLKFLINYNKRRRRLGSGGKDGCGDVPVVLVGNKNDQIYDRMVSHEEGLKRSKEIGCVCFHEISVRESIDQVWDVFRDVCSFWRVHSKNPSRLKRSVSEKEPISLDTIRLLSSAAVSPTSMTSCNYKPGTSGLRWTEEELEEETESSDGKQESSSASSPGVESPPFRERASTDGHIHKRPWRWRNPPPASSSSTSSADHQFYGTAKAERRMSISMRGSNASC
ncbi:unnamed protein product [Acanthoscelides obtectus]|nr:unnamed protein product [Acanthoscelides obtectus]CAK1664776.1 Ras-like protein family member 11A [Acanthoscelides obtectus]